MSLDLGDVRRRAVNTGRDIWNWVEDVPENTRDERRQVAGWWNSLSVTTRRVLMILGVVIVIGLVVWFFCSCKELGSKARPLVIQLSDVPSSPPVMRGGGLPTTLQSGMKVPDSLLNLFN